MAQGNNYIITDWSVSAGEPLKHHQVALALLVALGAPQLEILQLLPGLTPGQFSMLEKNKALTERAKEFRERFLGENSKEQFESYLPKGFEIMAEVMENRQGELKLKDRFEAAKWLFEKVTGKARQELEVSAGGTLAHFLRTLDEMKTERDVAPAAIALTEAPTKKDPIKDWVSQHIPKETR